MMQHGNKVICSGSHELPDDLKETFDKSVKLEWITIAYMVSTIFIIYITMKSSQAMKAAWLEDVLSTVPAISFLVASRYYNRKPTMKYPYGYHRVFSIAFQIDAFALLAIGLYIFYDSVSGLLKGERPAIGTVVVFGRHLWAGYLMIAALLWSSIPAVFIGRKKLPLAKALHNKILNTDANTQKADWQTAFAGIVGIIAVGFGFWWADAAAACFISLSVVRDGFKRLKESVSDLIDQVPTTLEDDDTLDVIDKVYNFMRAENWVKDVRLRMREAGEIFFAEIFVVPVSDRNLVANIEATYAGVKSLDWKIHDVVIVPVSSFSSADQLIFDN